MGSWLILQVNFYQYFFLLKVCLMVYLDNFRLDDQFIFLIFFCFAFFKKKTTQPLFSSCFLVHFLISEVVICV